MALLSTRKLLTFILIVGILNATLVVLNYEGDSLDIHPRIPEPRTSRVRAQTNRTHRQKLLVHERRDSNGQPKHGNESEATPNHSNPNIQNVPRRRWAYTTMIGGCDPDKPELHLGYLYNLLVMAYNLRTSGSKADIVVMIQMKFDSKHSTLDPEHERLLRDMDVKIKYLPKPPVKGSFYNLMLAKFHLLEMTEYSRILFLDGDVMPFCSLDYLFDLSEPLHPPGTARLKLKENLVVGGKGSPSNGGFFMLQPHEGDHELAQSIIDRHHRESLQTSRPYFDKRKGWGHIIEPPDYWRKYNGTTSTLWDYHGVVCDQGLLLYWVKYLKKSVSAITKGMMENWGSTDNGDVKLEETILRPFHGYSCVPANVSESESFASIPERYHGQLPYRDYRHFTGYDKPWLKPMPRLITSKESAKSSTEYWYYVLGVLKKHLDIPDLDLTDLRMSKQAVSGGPNLKEMRRNAELLTTAVREN